MSGSFKYRLEQFSDVIVIYLEGTLLSKDNTDDLIMKVEEIMSKNPTNLVLDLENLSYINSIGLTVLIMILTKSRNRGGDVILSNMPDRINQLLLVTKLNTVFTVVPSIDEAVQQFAKLN